MLKIVKILPKKTRPTKNFKRPRSGEAKLFLRTVTVLGAGVLRFSDILMMCLGVPVSDDIDAGCNLGEKCLNHIDAAFGLKPGLH